MATTQDMLTANAVSTKDEGKFWFVSLKPAAFTILGLSIIYAAFRVYQQWAAWKFGLDSTAVEFDTYWMTLLYAQLAVIVPVGAFIVLRIWMTRDRNLEQLAPKEEIKRLFFFVSWLGVYAFAFTATIMLFGEQDATWHQTVVRDTSFTPSHIVLFYMAVPVYTIVGTGAFIYALTRLPFYAKKISVPLIIVVAGPFMILPTVGFNEWGHAFWIMEEWFALPVHWGFVFFGWAIIALGGVLLQVTRRYIELFNEVFDSKGKMVA